MRFFKVGACVRDAVAVRASIVDASKFVIKLEVLDECDASIFLESEVTLTSFVVLRQFPGPQVHSPRQ